MLYIRLLVFVTALLPVFSVYAAAKHDDFPRAELDSLNAAIEKASLYRQHRYQHINDLKKVVKATEDPEAKWTKMLQLADEFRLVDADSAVHFAEEAFMLSQDIGDKDKSIRSLLTVINSLSTAGIITVAKSDFETLSTWQLPDDVKIEFWRTGRLLYNYLYEGMDPNNPYAEEAAERGRAYRDSLLAHIPSESSEYKTLMIERSIETGRYADARKMAEGLLSQLRQDDHLYGITALQLAAISHFQGDDPSYARYLALSATSDVKAYVREGMALPALSNWLYEHDELEDAYLYINFALEDAETGIARNRTLAIAKLVPFIENAYKKQVSSSRNLLLLSFIFVLGLLIATGVLVVVLVRRNRQIRDDREKLKKISAVRAAYVGNFVALCSNYASRLDSMSKIVGRKLASGQADELLKMVNSGKLAPSQDDEDFYNLFDKAFLEMYPEFVNEVNALLRPEEQITLKRDDAMTPELRIYAFVKLGVDESVKIAQVMRYSVSTVYAYRNRMRNRAINRETFDSDVRKGL